MKPVIQDIIDLLYPENDFRINNFDAFPIFGMDSKNEFVADSYLFEISFKQQIVLPITKSQIENDLAKLTGWEYIINL
jgi:hypothetical protein